MCIICSCVRVVREGDASIKRRTVSKCYVASSLRTRRKREKEKKGLKRHSKKEEREGLMKLITFPQSTVIEKKNTWSTLFHVRTTRCKSVFFLAAFFLFAIQKTNKQTKNKAKELKKKQVAATHFRCFTSLPSSLQEKKMRIHHSFFFFLIFIAGLT